MFIANIHWQSFPGFVISYTGCIKYYIYIYIYIYTGCIKKKVIELQRAIIRESLGV